MTSSKSILEVYPSDIICDEWLDRPTTKKFIENKHTHVKLGTEIKKVKVVKFPENRKGVKIL